MSPDAPWFWIVVGVGTVAVGAAGKWLWSAVTRALREWVREPVQKAEERADVAATHAEELKDTIGTKNGQGDLMSIATRLLLRQSEQFDWQREHDLKDDRTRADVLAIKAHLGLK